MKKTPFFESHKAKGAKLMSFSGWQMPFLYKSPTLEHLQTRKTGGLFDVSHMGQIRIRGRDSLSFLKTLLPSNLNNLKPGQALYSVLCFQDGGLIDDLILYVCGPKNYLLCVNAYAKDKDLQWIQSQAKNKELVVTDESDKWALIAVQGPKALDLCSRLFPLVDFTKISRFYFVEHKACLFSRTGYTGEEGFEIYIPWEKSLVVWDNFLKEGQALSIAPVGLGARDTLRLEMAYLLSGQDFDRQKSPLQAGLSWLVNSQEDYIGRGPLLNQQQEGFEPQLKAFVMEEAIGVPRNGCLVFSPKGEAIGRVTSGAKSPSLEKMIGLAYIKGAFKDCYIEIRGHKAKANIVTKPFLKNKGDK